MAKVQDCEDIASLRKIAAEYERQLKMTGIEMSEIPDDCATLVNKYADAKLKTHLPDLDMSFLDEFYITKKRSYIEHKYDKFRMESDIKDLEEQIEEEKRAAKVLEDFIADIKSRVDSTEEIEKKKFMIEKQIESLVQKQAKMFKPPPDFDIDELIRKAELYLSKKKPTKPK